MTDHHPFAETINLEFLDEPNDYAICEIKFDDKLLNPNGVIHGGVLYSMADTGMGRALHSALDDGEISATIEIKITYLRPAGRHDLTCKSSILKKGKRIAMLESEVFANGELVAKAAGSFAVFKPQFAAAG
jgi:acyl-CoA thioesterase